MNNKKTEYNNTMKRFQRIADGLGKGIDKGILKTVVLLNLLGFKTDGSCEGHPGTTSSEVPWVSFSLSTPDGDDWYDNTKQRIMVLQELATLKYKLIKLLSEFYEASKNNVSYDTMLGIHEIGYSFFVKSIGSELLNISEAGDKISIFGEKEHAQKLLNYTNEMSRFTDFLEKKYFRE